MKPKIVMLEGKGNCYQEAWRFIFGRGPYDDECTLIHGTIRFGGREAGHAWIELESGWIWDAQNTFMRPETFAALEPKEIRRYTKVEAIKLAARHGHYGPWER